MSQKCCALECSVPEQCITRLLTKGQAHGSMPKNMIVKDMSIIRASSGDQNITIRLRLCTLRRLSSNQLSGTCAAEIETSNQNELASDTKPSTEFKSHYRHLTLDTFQTPLNPLNINNGRFVRSPELIWQTAKDIPVSSTNKFSANSMILARDAVTVNKYSRKPVETTDDESSADRASLARSSSIESLDRELNGEQLKEGSEEQFTEESTPADEPSETPSETPPAEAEDYSEVSTEEQAAAIEETQPQKESQTHTDYAEKKSVQAEQRRPPEKAAKPQGTQQQDPKPVGPESQDALLPAVKKVPGFLPLNMAPQPLVWGSVIPG